MNITKSGVKNIVGVGVIAIPIITIEAIGLTAVTALAVGAFTSEGTKNLFHKTGQTINQFIGSISLPKIPANNHLSQPTSPCQFRRDI
jgi:hypothetical protein